MQTVGYIVPETEAEAQEIFAELRPTAQEIVRSIGMTMGFDRDEYRDRVSPASVRSAREALFGGLLVVTTGSMDEFSKWRERAPFDDFAVEIEGSDQVDFVAWHASPIAERVIAATYQNEREAAISMLRRFAWGRIYSDVLDDES